MSYRKADLFSLFDEAQIFLPHPDSAVLKTAQSAGISVRTCAQNLGIMENMGKSAEAMTCDYMLMLENDCPLIETRNEAQKQMSKSLDFLKSDDVIMARLRSLKSPGQTFTGLTKYRKLFDESPVSKATRFIRPRKVRRLSGYALYDSANAIKRHPNDLEDVGGGFHLVSAAAMPWTNQSVLVHRETFLTQILPLARAIKTKRGANKQPNLEIELNKAKAWRKSGWKIACGPGLFTHQRIGDRGYD